MFDTSFTIFSTNRKIWISFIVIYKGNLQLQIVKHSVCTGCPRNALGHPT